MTALILILVLGGILAGPIMSQVEQPDYQVISVVNDSDIEIRQYGAIIVAEVTVSGNRSESASEGFRLIADYIFGNNSVAQNIDMTAPVEQQSSTLSNVWRIRFIMPSEYTLATLPKPNNDQIRLYEEPDKRFAVITFSGRQSQSNIEEHEQILVSYLKRENVKWVGMPKYALYNPPWTLPILKRNEVMIEIQ